MEPHAVLASRPASGRHRKPERLPAARLGPAVALPDAAVTGRQIGGRYRAEPASEAEPGVYRALDERLSRWVRLAFVNLDSESVELVWGGFGTGSTVSHPAVGPLLDAGHDAATGLSYLVTELPGKHRIPLEDAVHLGLDPQRTSDTVRTLADLLVALHGSGLGHGDLTPPSLWIDTAAQARAIVRVDPIGLYRQSEDPDDARRGRAQDVFDLGVLMTQVLHAFRLRPGPADHFPFSDAELRGWSELTSAMLAAEASVRPSAAQVHDAVGAPASEPGGPGLYSADTRRWHLRPDRRR